jgi:hypothetical protein
MAFENALYLILAKAERSHANRYQKALTELVD